METKQKRRKEGEDDLEEGKKDTDFFHQVRLRPCAWERLCWAAA